MVLSSGAPREPLIDTLRGLALFGILAVNIQAYSYGLHGISLGILNEASSWADHATVIGIALFLQYKAYPLFCFCFGYGFALQTRRWRAQGVNASNRFARRTNFLLGLGAVHGVLLWFGDVLTSYGIAGKVIAAHIGKGPRRLLDPLRFWTVAWLIFSIPVVIALAWTTGDVAGESLKADTMESFRVYTQAGFWEALSYRAGDFVVYTTGFFLIGAELVLIMLLGAWCALTGVLRSPERHKLFWRSVLKAGIFIGIPVNACFALFAWQDAAHPWDSRGVLQALPDGFAATGAAMIISGLALARRSLIVRVLITILAPAGRYALTHYVTQSVLMFVLLSGSGLGWGASLKQAHLLGLASCIFVMQVLISHVALKAGFEGPLERWWRRYTYATSTNLQHRRGV